MKNEELSAYYRNCHLCPRNCGVDRSSLVRGICGEGAVVRAACAVLHRGEEPPIAGEKGSGALFFTGCSLGCNFCQNRQISRGGYGGERSVEELAGLFSRLEKEGAETIDLVTATHFAPSVATALEMASVKIPVVWNGSGYESPSTLDLIESFVDIHLPDLKTLSSERARRLFRAPDYPVVAKAAIERMGRSHPLEYKHGRLVRGVIVRHLVMPGLLEESKELLRWYAEHLADRTLLSLMVQFVDIDGGDDGPVLGEAQYDELVDFLGELGIEEGFIQESGDERPWIPDFTRDNPFPSAFSQPVWHC